MIVNVILVRICSVNVIKIIFLFCFVIISYCHSYSF